MGAAFRVAVFGAAFEGVFLVSQVLPWACRVSLVREARVPRAPIALLLALLAPPNLRSLPSLVAPLALAQLALPALGQVVQRFRDLSFFRWE